jgi:hypothetical protein
MIDNGAKITNKHLEFACLYNNKYAVNILSAYTNFTNKCLEYACFNKNKELIKQILNHKIIPDEDSLIALLIHSPNISIQNIYDMFNLLIDTGGILTKRILEYSVYTCLCIDKVIDRFGLKYDNNLYNMCHYHDYFPDKYLNRFNINKNILTFRKMFRVSEINLETILEFQKEHNLEIDQYCFDNACLKGSCDVLDYLLNLKNNNFRPSMHLLNTMEHKYNYEIKEKIYAFIEKYGIKKNKNSFYRCFIKRKKRYIVDYD